MKTIGDKLIEFDNTEGTVKDFNKIFNDTPLRGFSDYDIVIVGEITKNATTRILLINDRAIDHSFERRLNSEDKNIIDINNDSSIDDDYFWMCQFV